MVKRCSLVWLVVLVLGFAPNVSANTITWFGSGEVEEVYRQSYRYQGLDVGTPWSLTFELNPSAPVSFTTAPGCNGYYGALGASTLTLGPYTYTASGGTVYTQHDFPGGGCNAGGIVRSGQIQFLFNPESDDPDAWALEIFFLSYVDAVARDGSLPLAPSYVPGSYGVQVTNFGVPDYYWQRFGPTMFEVLDGQSAPVPEPATMTLFGAGLAALIARRRLRHQP